MGFLSLNAEDSKEVVGVAETLPQRLSTNSTVVGSAESWVLRWMQKVVAGQCRLGRFLLICIDFVAGMTMLVIFLVNGLWLAQCAMIDSRRSHCLQPVGETIN